MKALSGYFEGPGGPYAAIVGIDWADQSHRVCLLCEGSAKEERMQIGSDPASVIKFARWLHARVGSGKVAVVSEQSRGSLIYALLDFAFIDLYAINPQAAAKYRKSLYPSGAKSDDIDAEGLMRMLFTHRDRMIRVRRNDPASARLDAYSRHRRGLVDQRVQRCNQLGSYLKQYYPQALPMLGDELFAPINLAFLSRWPCYAKLARTREDSLRRFYHGQGSRSTAAIQRRLEAFGASHPLSADPMLDEICAMKVHDCIAQLRLLNRQISQIDKQLHKHFHAHPDRAIFASFPGAGPAMAPRLAAAWGTQRERYDHVTQAQAYSGIAPITVQSGNTWRVFTRRFAPVFLKQTFHEWAGLSIQYSDWAKACYRLMRDRGKSQHEAKRALAFKWMRIMFRCWKARTCYDESLYIQALIRRRSPVVDKMVEMGLLSEKEKLLCA